MDTHSWSGKSFVDNYLLWEINIMVEINIVGTNELTMLQVEKLGQIIMYELLLFVHFGEIDILIGISLLDLFT
jgi:hypothetical protein